MCVPTEVNFVGDAGSRIIAKRVVVPRTYTREVGKVNCLHSTLVGGEYYLHFGKKLLAKPPGEPEVKIRKLAKKNFPFQKCK